MVYRNLLNNSNIVTKAELGGMQVIEYERDMSVQPWTSETEYYCAKMGISRRQLLLNLNGNSYTIQAGAMQWIDGNVSMGTGVSGVGDFLGKMVSSAVTKESVVKPQYSGYGQVMLEPTYRHIILTDVSSWGGSVVLDDGLFLACDSTLKQKVVARNNLSSAVLGKEGLFNLSLNGSGICALESIVPYEELFEIVLDNDVIKIDGNMAIAWSGSLEFTVEKSAKSLVGSAVSGEGFVNVYSGSGKIWMAPVLETGGSAGVDAPTETASTGRTGSVAAKNNPLDKVEKVTSFLNRFS